MKRAQLIVAGLAVVAGVGAFMLSGSRTKTVVVQAPAPEVKTTPSAEILVVTAAVPIGGALTEKNLAWKLWPNDSISKFYIKKSETPKGLEEYKGALSRFSLLAGDPVNSARVAKGQNGGVMAAILPQGMRAIAVPISPETGVGGFILPNDRVDVILTRREAAAPGGKQNNVISETILSNVRVLAIDQTVQEEDGKKVVLGRTGTLELSPKQTESLQMAKQLGDISLSLRSLADSNTPEQSPDIPELQNASGSMTVVRFGVTTTVPVSR